MCAIKRRPEAVTCPDPAQYGGKDELAELNPNLWEFLTLSTYEDGKPRQLPTMMVFFDAPLVKVCLNDRDQGLSAWVLSPGLLGAFQALERGLEGDCLEWRKANAQGKRKR